MELKFHGARRLTIRAWDALRESKGAVVFISGNAAVTPWAGAAAVGAINAAIEALAKAFAERGIEDGVQVNSVSPGAIMTGRRLSMLEKVAASKMITLEETKQQLLKQAGIARFGEAEEIADLMAFIVSPAAALDDRHGASHGWWRGEVSVTCNGANHRFGRTSTRSVGGGRE